jgi:hypothetical protein
MTPHARTGLLGRMTLCSLASLLAIASTRFAGAPLAQLSPPDSASACRRAIKPAEESPYVLYSPVALDRAAALRCTGLPPTADTLDVLEALVNHGWDRNVLGHYALAVANQRLHAAGISESAPDRERGLASLRVAYRIKPLTSTGLLLSDVATELALRLQESRQCSDVVRARELLAEARTVYPDKKLVSHVPDWSAVELKAAETVKRVCGRPAAPQTHREPPQN